MKKKLMALMLAVSMTACGSAATVLAEEAKITEITEGVCETPIVLTSIGQSADVDIAKTLLTKAGIEDFTCNATIAADELDDTVKTLILAVGGSSKGLGAAGIDADQELARCDEILAKADELGITVLAMHTGGSARRGTLSDSFITPAFTAADLAIVVSEGDEDGFIKAIMDETGAPVEYVEKAVGVLDVLKTVFAVG